MAANPKEGLFIVHNVVEVYRRRSKELAAIGFLAVAGCGQHQVIDPGTAPVTGQTPVRVISQQPGNFSHNGEPIQHVPISQVVEIPDREQTQEYHKVQPGETLSGIARAYQISLERLLESNGLEANASLQPGELIYVPPAR